MVLCSLFDSLCLCTEEKASTSKLISTLQLLVENDSKLSLMTLARERLVDLDVAIFLPTVTTVLLRITLLLLVLVFASTVNFGYNDIGYNDISLITTLISCPELFSISYHTKSFGYNDTLNNETSQITTHISCPKALNHCEYNDQHYSLTVLASPLKKLAQQIRRLVPRGHMTKHAPVKNGMCGLLFDYIHHKYLVWKYRKSP